jgi:hypothetical protein
VDEIGDVEYDYQGTTWLLPGGLVALQIELARAEAACAAAVAANDDAALKAARERRLELVVEKFRRAEPWRETFKDYDRWRADWALQDYARRAVQENVPAAAAAGE